MKVRTFFAAMAASAFVLSGTATSALAQSTDSRSATPAQKQSAVTTLTIRCDAGKTSVVQNTFVGESGATSTVIAVTTGAGNLYTVAYIEKKAIAQTIKGVGAKEAEPIDMSALLFLLDIESPNYMLLARRQPNDCVKMK